MTQLTFDTIFPAKIPKKEIKITGSHDFHNTQENSMEAFLNLETSGKLSKQELRVLEAFKSHGLNTANELSIKAQISIRGCAARINGLYAKGRLDIFNVVADSYTQETAWLYGIPTPKPESNGWYCISDLLKRGWTKSLIGKNRVFISEDDDATNPHYPNSLNAPPMQLFLKKRVEKIESEAEFKEHLAKRKKK